LISMAQHSDPQVRQYSALLLADVSNESSNIPQMTWASGPLYNLTHDANSHTRSAAKNALGNILSYKPNQSESGEFTYSLETSLKHTSITPSERIDAQGYQPPTDVISNTVSYGAVAAVAVAGTVATGWIWGPLRVWLREGFVNRHLTVDQAKKIFRTVGLKTAIGSTTLLGVWWIGKNLI